MSRLDETLSNLRDIYGHGYANIFTDVTDTVAKHHISKPQMDIITYLFINGHATPSELAEVLETKKSAIAHTLKKLDDKKLITSEPNPFTNDRRSKLVYMTDDAKELLIEFLKSIYDKIADDIRGISDEELLELHHATATVKKYINGGQLHEIYPEI